MAAAADAVAETAADNYPTPLSASSPEKEGTTPPSQASPSSPQTDDTPQLPDAAQLEVKSNRLAARDLSLISSLDSSQTYGTSENSKLPPAPAPAAHQISAEGVIPFNNQRLSTSNMPGTTERNNSSQSSAHHPVDTSRISSQQPIQYSVPISDSTITASHSSPMEIDVFLSNEPPSVHDEIYRSSISNVDGAQNLAPLPALNDFSPVYSEVLGQPEMTAAREPLTQAYTNLNMNIPYGFALKDQSLPELSQYQQNHLLPNGQSSILPPNLDHNFSIPSESSFRHTETLQPVAYEGLGYLHHAPDASAASNIHVDKWHSHQGDTQLFDLSVPEGAVGIQKNICKHPHDGFLTTGAPLNPTESHFSVAGIGSSSHGNTDPLPGSSCNAESGIRYLYEGGETVGQISSFEANNCDDWSEGAGDIA